MKQSKTTSLHSVLCGCETSSLAVEKERRLSVFENRELRRIFGPKREEVAGAVQDNIMRKLYASPHIRVIKSRR